MDLGLIILFIVGVNKILCSQVLKVIYGNSKRIKRNTTKKNEDIEKDKGFYAFLNVSKSKFRLKIPIKQGFLQEFYGQEAILNSQRLVSRISIK